MSGARTRALSTYKFWRNGIPDQVGETTIPSQLYRRHFTDWKPSRQLFQHGRGVEVSFPFGMLAQLISDLEHAASRGSSSLSRRQLRMLCEYIFQRTTHGQDMCQNVISSLPENVSNNNISKSVLSLLLHSLGWFCWKWICQNTDDSFHIFRVSVVTKI